MFTTIEAESSPALESATGAGLTAIVSQGLALARRHWPLIVWGYAINLVFALVAAAPVSNGLAPFLDHSLAAQKISGTLGLGTVGQLALLLRDAHFVSIVFSVATWLNLLELFLLFTLFAATVNVYLSGKARTFSGAVSGGSLWFWPFLRGSLLASCVAGGLVGCGMGARSAIMSWLEQGSTGQSMFTYTVLSGGVVFLIAALARLWFDVVEIFIIRNAITGEPRARHALLPAWRFLMRNFLRLSGGFLLIGFLATAVLALCLLLWKALPANLVWLAFLLGQTGLFALLAGRFWQRGFEASLLLAAKPLVVPVAEEVPESEEEMPVLTGIAGLGGLAEPTLSELVQKLRSGPWSQPALPPPPRAEGVAEPPPAPEPTLVPAGDSMGAEQIATSPLDLHVTKFPLGGVPVAGPEDKKPSA